MAEVIKLDVAASAAWRGWINRSCRHDFYHLPEYHALAEEMGEGKAALFVFEDGGCFAAFPMLLRQIELVQGLEAEGRGLLDATSVYGYAGPVASHEALPPDFVAAFKNALAAKLNELRVVTAFSRLHPLIQSQKNYLEGIGERIPLGKTISIDLSLPPDAQFARFTKVRRYDIKRLRQMGVSCREDGGENLPVFAEIYTGNMRRVNADSYYFFDKRYFDGLMRNLRQHFHLFVCEKDGEIICGGIFFLCGGIVQYHLSGTRENHLKLAPTKLMLDTVRQWANAKGARVFHLGGGLGSAEDSLFKFKAGFSGRRHEFAVWRWILDPEKHARLCAAKSSFASANSLKPANPSFFPAYRASLSSAAAH